MARLLLFTGKIDLGPNNEDAKIKEGIDNEDQNEK